ncbi:MAG TPA: branched-chain amino acid ABC transporter permease [Bacillales bacterium]|nr:branched-chain amino acid ABC transporter permease [Bacillales bacterium]
MAKAIRNIYNRSLTGPLLVCLFLALLPVGFPSNYILSILIIVAFYTIVGTGLTLLMGYAGQISLGHAAFYGIGSYTSAILSAHAGLSPWLAMLAGMVLSALVAFIVGIPTLKLKEHYLALATLGFGVIVFVFFKELDGLTGGLNGFFGIPSISLFGFPFDNDFRFYYLIWTLAMLGIIFARNVVQSRVGRALQAVKDSETAANSLGVPAQKYKLQIFVLSAVYASVAGSLYAHYVSFINPELFNVKTSLDFLIMVVIGGSGMVWGGVIGAAVFVILGEILKEILPYFTDASGEFQIVLFGVLLVVILIYMPRGLGPMVVQTAKNRLRFGKRKAAAASGGDRSA